jgi:hypothetical protein
MAGTNLLKKKSSVSVPLTNLKDGHRSQYVNEFFKKNNFPKEKEVRDLPVDTINDMEKKIALMERYYKVKKNIVDQMAVIGVDFLNLTDSIVDLQGKLWELEDKLAKEGKNPLEDKRWVEARKLLMSDIQFVHKQGLTALDIESKIQNRKERLNEDIVFELAPNGE